MSDDRSAVAIRRGTADEAAEVAAVIREAFQDVAVRVGLTPQNCPRHPSNCVAQWIDEAMAKGVAFWVAVADGRLCATVGMTPPGSGACELVRLAVLPQWRRRGLGEAMVRQVLNEAARLGLVRVELATVAKPDDLLRWYEKIGFVLDRMETVKHLPFEVGYMSLNLRTMRGDGQRKERAL